MNKFLLTALAASACATSAFAAIAFNDFDGSGGFNTGTGWTIAGVNGAVGNNWDQGNEFVSLTTGDVNKITVAIGYVTGTNSCTMRLYADSGSDTPGALKGTWGISGMGAFGSAYSPSAISVAPGVGLVTGQKYWLIADSADDAWLAWNWNNTGVNQLKYWNNNGTVSYSNDVAGAYRVDTTPVPEPVSMIALGAGVLAMVRRRRSS